MAKNTKRENSSEKPEELLKKAEKDLIQKGDIITDADDVELDANDVVNDNQKMMIELREKVEDTFDFYPDEEFLYVAEDGTAFLQKNLNYAHNYGKSTNQKIYKIQR